MIFSQCILLYFNAFAMSLAHFGFFLCDEDNFWDFYFFLHKRLKITQYSWETKNSKPPKTISHILDSIKLVLRFDYQNTTKHLICKDIYCNLRIMENYLMQIYLFMVNKEQFSMHL